MNTNKYLKQLKKRHMHVPLSAHEKTYLKRDILKYIEEHPLSQDVTERQKKPVSTLYSFQRAAGMMTVYILAFGVLHPYLSSSTVATVLFADEESLQKRLPYEEPPTPPFDLGPAKNVSSVPLTDKLKEAEELLLSKEFEPDTMRSIQEDLDTYTNTLHTYMRDAEQQGEKDHALAVSAQLESLLKAHLTILKALAQNQTDNAEVSAFIAAVASESERAEEMRSALEESSNSTESSSEEIEAYAQSVLIQLESIDTELSQQIGTSSEDVHQEIIKEAEVLIEGSQILHQATRKHWEEGNSEAAERTVRETLQSLERAIILIQSYEELRDSSGS